MHLININMNMKDLDGAWAGEGLVRGHSAIKIQLQSNVMC